jgi:pyruvate/2-oxoglutarate dehydrogenase complex dihydrolipoamide dehydrogenase (E3) component
VDAETLLGTDWDVVIVATGGTPAVPAVPGGHLVTDTWDVLSGARRLRGSVLLYDDHGGNQALDAAEALVRGGAGVELVTPERTLSPDVGSLTAAGYIASLAHHRVGITVLRRLRSVRKVPEGFAVTLGIDGDDFEETRVVDAVVAEMGTEPVTDLYDELLPRSTNLGEVDIGDLLARRPQTSVRNEAGSHQLFRIGDAVASRNVHAAMLDAARLCRAM